MYLRNTGTYVYVHMLISEISVNTNHMDSCIIHTLNEGPKCLYMYHTYYRQLMELAQNKIKLPH